MSKLNLEAFRKQLIKITPQSQEKILTLTDQQVIDLALTAGLIKPKDLEKKPSPTNAQNDGRIAPNTVKATKENPQKRNQPELKLSQNQRQKFIKLIISLYPDMQAGVRNLDDCDVKECYDEIKQKIQSDRKQALKKNIFTKDGKLNTALMKQQLISRMPNKKTEIINLPDSQIERLCNLMRMKSQLSKEKGQAQGQSQFGAPETGRKKRKFWGRQKRGHNSRSHSGFTHSNINGNTYNNIDTYNNHTNTNIIRDPNVNTINIQNNTNPYRSYTMVDSMGAACVIKRFGDKLINLSQYPFYKVNLEKEKLEYNTYKTPQRNSNNQTQSMNFKASRSQQQPQYQKERDRKLLAIPPPPPSFEFSRIMSNNNYKAPNQGNSNDRSVQSFYTSKKTQKQQDQSLYNDNLIRMLKPMPIKSDSQFNSNQFFSSQFSNFKKNQNSYLEKNKKQQWKEQPKRKTLSNQRKSVDAARQDRHRREQAGITKAGRQVKGESASRDLLGRIDGKLGKVFKYRSWERSQSDDESPPQQ